jgi:CRP/FNR family transcriptional regulator, cyclic AMP receptor protein
MSASGCEQTRSGSASALSSIGVFENLSKAELDRLERGMLILEPHDGDEIFGQGDPADAVYAIIGGIGRVRIGALDRHSKALMVQVFHVGDIFGEIGVIDRHTRTAAAVAEGRLRVARIGAPAFLSALACGPKLGEALCRILAQRLRRTFELFQDATFERLEVRLARQILYLASHEARQTDKGLRLISRLRQADLADLVGATTRSIITILNSWRSRNIVIYDADRAVLTVPSKAALQAIIETDTVP